MVQRTHEHREFGSQQAIATLPEETDSNSEGFLESAGKMVGAVVEFAWSKLTGDSWIFPV